MQKQKIGARDLLLDTLTKIGCQYDFDEDYDGVIHFAYQGEHFYVITHANHSYRSIYDYAWEGVELSDIDEVARLRKAINEANWNSSVTILFTIEDESKTMDVHCKSVVYLSSEIPNLEEYLRIELNEFFNAHHELACVMTQLRKEDAQGTGR